MLLLIIFSGQLADQLCRDDEEESSKGTIQEGQWMWKQLEEIKMSTPRDFKERTPKGYYDAMKANFKDPCVC